MITPVNVLPILRYKMSILNLAFLPGSHWSKGSSVSSMRTQFTRHATPEPANLVHPALNLSKQSYSNLYSLSCKWTLHIPSQYVQCMRMFSLIKTTTMCFKVDTIILSKVHNKQVMFIKGFDCIASSNFFRYLKLKLLLIWYSFKAKIPNQRSGRTICLDTKGSEFDSRSDQSRKRSFYNWHGTWILHDTPVNNTWFAGTS